MHAFAALILAQTAQGPLRRAMWLLLLLGIAAIVLARIMVMLNRAAVRRLRAGDKNPPTRTSPSARRRTDPWAEAGRRVPLEDDPDVPREPPDEPPPQRGFNDRR